MPPALSLNCASALAAGDPYQVVLLDMQMPGTNGLTLARSIKAESELAGVRLVLLSSFGGRINAEELKAAGIDDCLVKPVKQSLLFDSLATVMAGSVAGSTSKAKKSFAAFKFPSCRNSEIAHPPGRGQHRKPTSSHRSVAETRLSGGRRGRRN